MITRRPGLILLTTALCSMVAGWCLLPQSVRDKLFPTAHAAAFIVNVADDHNDGTCNGADCTLREAINAVNAGSGGDTISFNIAGGGIRTINLTSALPDITKTVTIDGTTQPGFPGTPLIELNGTGAGAANGLNFQVGSGSSTVKGLVINRFAQRGINAEVGINVQGCYIGTSADGTAAQGNGTGGVRLNSGGSTIGGTTAAARNVISGNTTNGIIIVTGSNTVQGNYIGTNAAGTAAVGNTVDGMSVASNGNTIGGTAAGAGNLISGNGENGVTISGSNNQVQGNLVGTNAAGSGGLGNGSSLIGNFNGILITFTGTNNTIGGTAAGARNILAGSLVSNNGIRIAGSSNTVQGNYIGTDVTGQVTLGGVRSGMTIQGSNNLIGGTTAAARNIISGNGFGSGGLGIDICCDGGATGNQVQGNYIGLKADGASALLNNGGGVRVGSGNPNNTIGGTAAGAGNVISGNSGPGVQIVQNGNNAVLVQGNIIGLNPAGTTVIANSYGVYIETPSSGSTIGGTTAAARNVISGNQISNVYLTGAGTTGNLIQGNYIGTQANGTSAVSNPGRGVYILDGATNNTIGGTAAGAGNLVAFNTLGVGLDVGSGNGNAILGNSVFSNTGLGIDLGLDGVTANDACDSDTGPNTRQNFPVITSVTPGATNTTISGTLNSTASTQFRLEFFANASSDSSGNGEGQVFLGSTNVTTDGSCSGSFNFIVPNVSITEPFITATATDPNNNTSEFSASVLDAGVTPKTLQFSSANFNVGEGAGHVTVSVTRSGDATGVATVDFRTTDTDNFTVNCANKAGQAFARCDFATVVGTLTWAAGDASSKSFDVPVINDSYGENSETFGVALTNATGGSLGTQSTATVTITDNEATDGPNPILQGNAAGVSFFVRQHYLDFFGREPEVGEPWSGVLNGCTDQFNFDPMNPSAACDRIMVSGSIFGSPEFKDKGIYVIDFYRVAFDRRPTYLEFVFDLASITGVTALEVQAKRSAFANNFVLRGEFGTLAGLTNNNYVNTLMSHNGQYNLLSIHTPDPANPDGATKVTLTTADLINRLNNVTLTRAQVLRAIVQSDEVTQNLESVNAFVASQYYGYLRRSPDTTGFNGWVNHLRNNPTDFRTMIHGFLNSTEYRLRFGPVGP
jgi:CSLREA domain-containing protein